MHGRRPDIIAEPGTGDRRLALRADDRGRRGPRQGQRTDVDVLVETTVIRGRLSPGQGGPCGTRGYLAAADNVARGLDALPQHVLRETGDVVRFGEVLPHPRGQGHEKA